MRWRSVPAGEAGGRTALTPVGGPQQAELLLEDLVRPNRVQLGVDQSQQGCHAVAVLRRAAGRARCGEGALRARPGGLG